MNKGIGRNHINNMSIKNSVDLLYSTFNYRVEDTHKLSYQQQQSNYKQDLQSQVSLPKSEQDNKFAKSFHYPNSKNQSLYKSDYDKSLTENNTFNQYNNYYGDKNNIDSDQDSPTSTFKQTKKITFFNPTIMNGNKPLLASNFSTQMKRLASIGNRIGDNDNEYENNYKFQSELNKNKKTSPQENSNSINEGDSKDKSKLNRSNTSNSKKFKNSKDGSSPKGSKKGNKNKQQQIVKSNFYDDGNSVSNNQNQLQQQIDESSSFHEQNSKIQEVIRNIQHEESSNIKKKKNKRKLFIQTNHDDRNKMQNNQIPNNKSNNNFNTSKGSLVAGLSVTSIKDGEDDPPSNHHLGLAYPHKFSDGKSSSKAQQKEQVMNLENFRLQRRFSDDEIDKLSPSQQQLQDEENQKNLQFDFDYLESFQNQRNHGFMNNKQSMQDQFDKNNAFPNQYLDQYTRLGMEEWKMSKLKMGEFLWNSKISQLKAQIKQKMPAYSTSLLKKWEDYDLVPSNYSSKRNISQHKPYISPQNKYKHSFNFYSPSNALLNQNQSFITSNTMYNQPNLQNNNNNDKNNNNNNLENKEIIQKKVQLISPHSTLKTSSSNPVFMSTSYTTTQFDIKNNTTTKINNQDKSQSKLNNNNNQQSVSFNQPHNFNNNHVNYQSKFQQTQNKLKSMKADVKLMDKQIRDHQNQTKDKPIIPKQLIEMAKKQSQTSFFQLQDLGKKKKTFNFFEKTPQYSTQEDVDDLQTIKKLKQRSNTYKIFRNHVRQYLSSQKD